MIEASPFRSFTVSVSLSTNSDETVIGEMMIGETTTDGKSDELALQGSNLRPPVPKTGVLPTELRAIRKYDISPNGASLLFPNIPGQAGTRRFLT